MPVVLTAPVEGLQPGATYTGPNEAYHLAAGNASQVGYVGPGVANTGAADATIADNREFDSTRGQIARRSNQPTGGTNDGLVLKNAAAPTVAYSGQDGPRGTTEAHAGMANDPDEWPLEIASLSPTSGPITGGTVVTITGRGFTNVTGANVTGVTIKGVAGTALTIDDDKTLRITTGATAAAGVGDVVVTRPSGSVTKTGAYTYV